MKTRELQIRYDYWLELIVLTLMAMGTVFVFSAGASVAGQYDWKRFYDFTTLKQLLFFPAAVAVMYLFSIVDYRGFSLAAKNPFKSFTPYLLALSLLLLVAVLIFGVERNYSKRWLDIAPGPVYISFQPSEMAKWVILIFLAAILGRCGDNMKSFLRRFVPICVVPATAVVLIITQDFGTAAYIAMLSLLMLWLGGAVWWHFLVPLPVAAIGFVAAVLSSPTRINRIKAFLDSQNIPYQADQSLRAIATGGIFGKGLGMGVFKYGHLPEDTTDFIFSIVAEETGFVGAATVIVLFILFTVLGLAAVRRCEDRFGRLLGYGIVLCIAIQAAINIGVVTVILPTKGIPLPFISAGGTSMLLTAAAMGILLNITRQTQDRLDPATAGVFLQKGYS
jgi:cell division protein FtsW